MEIATVRHNALKIPTVFMFFSCLCCQFASLTTTKTDVESGQTISVARPPMGAPHVVRPIRLPQYRTNRSNFRLKPACDAPTLLNLIHRLTKRKAFSHPPHDRSKPPQVQHPDSTRPQASGT